jgi:hypothetical protein
MTCLFLQVLWVHAFLGIGLQNPWELCTKPRARMCVYVIFFLNPWIILTTRPICRKLIQRKDRVIPVSFCWQWQPGEPSTYKYKVPDLTGVYHNFKINRQPLVDVTAPTTNSRRPGLQFKHSMVWTSQTDITSTHWWVSRSALSTLTPTPSPQPHSRYSYSRLTIFPHYNVWPHSPLLYYAWVFRNLDFQHQTWTENRNLKYPPILDNY